MEFLYPTSRQFPVDKVCEQIIRELEKRHWDVPGIDVEFKDYGNWAQKFGAVSRIKGHDFKLWFCRIQRLIPGSHWNDTAGVSQIVIPGKELNLYQDESGPTFYLYVGNDYERDREKFMNGSKVNSKLNGEPKVYLQYTGRCDCRATGGTEKLAQMNHTHSGHRSPFLVHTNDLGREYDPQGDEPKLFPTNKVMAEFEQYLEGVVLKMIVSHNR